MIEFLSSWAKSLGLAIVIVSILEMLLPNNKTKKYIRMVMGVYVIFSIISPFIQNKEIFDFNSLDLENYTAQTSVVVDQTSMDQRIEKLYIEELEKDVTKKIKEQGFEVTKCKVEAQISDQEDETKITKIKISVKKSKEAQNQKEESDEKIENKVVTQIQKIKPIDTEVQKEAEEKNDKKEDTEMKVTKADIQNLKKFLMEEYEVSEKCLEIN